MTDESATQGDQPVPESERLKLFGSWMTVQQAELMLQHVHASGAKWPEVALYLQSCITAIRSVTLTMQKALGHEPGFAEWYEREAGKLADDREMKFLVEARNHLLKRGALKLKHAYAFRYTGDLPIRVRGWGPDGPEVWVRNPESPEEEVPVDWRRLDGFEFEIPLRFGPLDRVPEPPEREVKELLREKIGRLRLLVLDAEERFDPDSFDAAEAAKQRAVIGADLGFPASPAAE